MISRPDKENRLERNVEAVKPPPASRRTPARTFLGTTLAVFFTITGTGTAFLATCAATVISTDTRNRDVGIALGSIAAMLAAAGLLKLFWNEPPSAPK
jgi:hypothetical protein